MIERCLLFHMSRDDCVKALAKHAKIEPIITLTGKVLFTLSSAIHVYILSVFWHTWAGAFAVWKELLKENKAFFQEYFQAMSPRQFSSKANKTLHAYDQFGKLEYFEKFKTNGFLKRLYPSYKENEISLLFQLVIHRSP